MGTEPPVPLVQVPGVGIMGLIPMPNSMQFERHGTPWFLSHANGDEIAVLASRNDKEYLALTEERDGERLA